MLKKGLTSKELDVALNACTEQSVRFKQHKDDEWSAEVRLRVKMYEYEEYLIIGPSQTIVKEMVRTLLHTGNKK